MKKGAYRFARGMYSICVIEFIEYIDRFSATPKHEIRVLFRIYRALFGKAVKDRQGWSTRALRLVLRLLKKCGISRGFWSILLDSKSGAAQAVEGSNPLPSAFITPSHAKSCVVFSFHAMGGVCMASEAEVEPFSVFRCNACWRTMAEADFSYGFPTLDYSQL
jgi:hypothetical protein